MFLQGGRCFFCQDNLPRERASIEHLNAVANGGVSQDSNCVACCRELNTALGSLSIKEKVQAFLNQQGDFVCPAKRELVLQATATEVQVLGASRKDTIPKLVAPAKSKTSAKKAAKPKKPKNSDKPKKSEKGKKAKPEKPAIEVSVSSERPIDSDIETIVLLVHGLKGPPKSVKALKKWIKHSYYKNASAEYLQACVEGLQQKGFIYLAGNKITYASTVQAVHLLGAQGGFSDEEIPF